MLDREKVIKAWECCNPFNMKCNECPYEKDCYHDGISRHMVADALALLKEYKQSEQSYLRTLVELSNERDKLLKELGREDEHKYKDGSFMAGGNGIVKL